MGFLLAAVAGCVGIILASPPTDRGETVGWLACMLGMAVVLGLCLRAVL
jgi:hypothetical protein